MAKSVELTKTILLTDGGATAIDRQFTKTAELDEVTEGTLRIAASGSKFLCVAGSEGEEASPLSLGLSSIRGLFLSLDVQAEVQLDGANPGFLTGPGELLLDACVLESVKVVAVAEANIKYIIWGNR